LPYIEIGFISSISVLGFSKFIDGPLAVWLLTNKNLLIFGDEINVASNKFIVLSTFAFLYCSQFLAVTAPPT